MQTGHKGRRRRRQHDLQGSPHPPCLSQALSAQTLPPLHHTGCQVGPCKRPGPCSGRPCLPPSSARSPNPLGSQLQCDHGCSDIGASRQHCCQARPGGGRGCAAAAATVATQVVVMCWSSMRQPRLPPAIALRSARLPGRRRASARPSLVGAQCKLAPVPAVRTRPIPLGSLCCAAPPLRLRYYDLAELRREFGPWIDGYAASKPGRYHEGCAAGDLSQTGDVAALLLRSLAERGAYEEPDFCARLDGYLDTLDGSPYCVVGARTNYTDVAMRDLWRARKAGPGSGGRLAGWRRVRLSLPAGWLAGEAADLCRLAPPSRHAGGGQGVGRGRQLQRHRGGSDPRGDAGGAVSEAARSGRRAQSPCTASDSSGG